MANVERQLRRLVEKVGAERVTVSVTYDKDSWHKRRGNQTWPFEVELEWEDDNEKVVVSGSKAKTLAAALDDTEAELNGRLLRERQ